MEPNFNIKLNIKNYKQIGVEDPFEAELNGEVLLISGDNGRGKTGLLNAIAEAWALKSGTPNPLTVGKESGHKKITIPSLDGEEITIVHNFTEDNPTGMFYAIKKDGKVVNSLPTIRKLIGDYAPVTVEQFFADMKYAESRKKLVKNFLVPLMGENANRIEEINKMINENGSLYKQRRELNSTINSIQSGSGTLGITNEQQELLSKKADIEAALKSLKKESDQLSNQHNDLTKTIFSFDVLIDNLTSTLPVLKSHVSESTLSKYESVLSDIINERDVINEEGKKVTEEFNKLKNRIERGNNAMSQISSAESILSVITSQKTKLESVIAEKEAVEKEMLKLKAERESIIKNANLPNGIETDGENITLHGFDFVAEQVSYSEAALSIAEIMAQLFSGRIICLGNIAEFGPANRKRIFEIAKKYQKFVVVTQVTDDTEVKIQAIVE